MITDNHVKRGVSVWGEKSVKQKGRGRGATWKACVFQRRMPERTVRYKNGSE